MLTEDKCLSLSVIIKVQVMKYSIIMLLFLLTSCNKEKAKLEEKLEGKQFAITRFVTQEYQDGVLNHTLRNCDKGCGGYIRFDNGFATIWVVQDEGQSTMTSNHSQSYGISKKGELSIGSRPVTITYLSNDTLRFEWQFSLRIFGHDWIYTTLLGCIEPK